MISPIRIFVRTVFHRNARIAAKAKKTNKYTEGRMLDRFFAREMNGKKQSIQTGLQLKVNIFEPSNKDSGSRKGTALNKVYMEHMIELIQSGNHSAKLLEEGLEITGVKLVKGGDFINIYWICNNEKLTEEAISKMLQPALKELQEKMGSIRYVAKPPYIRFVRDLKMERAQTVERLLKIADFGEDHEPVYPESVITPDCNFFDDGLPVMRQDLLGVNHAAIKAKILTAVETYKVTHMLKENEFAYVEMENLIPFDKKTFAKFYKRKRILDRKLTSRGLLGWRRSQTYEEEEVEDNEYVNEFWEAIEKEQKEEEKEHAAD